MGEACGVSRWGLGEGREAQPAVTHGATQLLGAQIQGRWHTKSRDQAVGWGEVTSFFSSLLRTIFFYFLCHSFSCPLRISLSGLALPSSPPSSSLFPLLRSLRPGRPQTGILPCLQDEWTAPIPRPRRPVNKILNKAKQDTPADLPTDTHTLTLILGAHTCTHTGTLTHIFFITSSNTVFLPS